MRGAFLGFVGATNESLRLIIIILDQNNFARVTSDPKKSVKGSISEKLVIRTLCFERGEFSRFFVAPNESLRLIVIYYMFQNMFGHKTTLLESYQIQKSPLKAPFRQNMLYGLSFCTRCILRFVGARNESLRLIIIYYMFKNTIGIKTTLVESHRS